MLEMRFEGLDRVVSKYAALPQMIAGPLRKFLTRAVVDLEGESKREIRALGAVDTGRLGASPTHQVDGSAVPLWGQVGTNVDYAPYVHEGRAPGKAPPIAAIQKWVHRKGLGGSVQGQGKVRRAPAAVERNIAFRIAMKIKAKGIKPRPFFRNAAQTALPRLQGYAEAASKEIEAGWGR